MKGKNKKTIGEFFRDNYSLSWKFLKESKKSIYIIALVFLVFSLAGFFIETPEHISLQIIQMLQEISERAKGLSEFGIIKFIFLNNIQSSILGLVLGIFVGIFPVFFAAFNGYILGFVLFLSVQSGGVLELWKIFPHGIFELPAVFISLGIGLRLGMQFLRPDKKDSLKNFIIDAGKTFVFVVIPLLAVAAIIEGVLISFLR